MVIDAGASVTIQAGGHSISISAAGIFSNIPIKLAGAAVPLVTGLPQSLLAPLSRVQVNSFKRSAPFCEECERCRNGQCEIA